jgi:hypothetical protein
MPKQHRGLGPRDEKAFNHANLLRLKTAVHDLSWLLSRRYAAKAALELVGNHYQLSARQRLAVAHAAYDGSQRKKPLPLDALEGRELVIDGFNLLILIETALGGGIVIRCADGCYRDIESVYGSYRMTFETKDAIALISEVLAAQKPKSVLWLFDRPVSNSGRISNFINAIAAENGWPFLAKAVERVDSLLIESPRVVITSDSAILNQSDEWCNLAAYLIDSRIAVANIIDLWPAE